jgi:hypothetical protein
MSNNEPLFGGVFFSRYNCSGLLLTNRRPFGLRQ